MLVRRAVQIDHDLIKRHLIPYVKTDQLRGDDAVDVFNRLVNAQSVILQLVAIA